MVRKKIIDELNEKLEQMQDLNKQKIIRKIFKNKDWYSDVNLDMFLNILFDLGYDKKSSIEIYKILITSN